jgi:HEPN domain-containing protein
MDPLIKKGVDYLKSAKILFDNEYYEQAMAMIFYGLPYLIKGIVKEKTDSYIYTKDISSMLNFMSKKPEYKDSIDKFLSSNGEKIKQINFMKVYLKYDIVDPIDKDLVEGFLKVVDDALNLCERLGPCKDE